MHSPKNLSSCWLTNKYPAYMPHSEEFNHVMLTEILDYLVIGMEEEFFRIKKDFETFIKVNLDFKANCLHQGKILNNVKAINDLYTGKYFNIIEDMDERFFLKERKTIFTPSKFTPFARNSTNIHINKRQSSGTGTRPILEDKKQQLNSHRVLNYEMPPPVKITSNFREIKFNNMIQSPYSMKIMTQATPLTGKMEMHNWLYSKVNPSRGLTNASGNRKDGTFNLSQSLERYVSVLDTHTRNVIFNSDLMNFASLMGHIENEEIDKSNNVYVKDERKKEMIYLYLEILEEILASNERKYNIANFKDVLMNQSFHRSLFVCCLETFYFIRNIKIVNLEKVLDLYELEPVQFWRVFHPFMRYDQRMPPLLRKKLFEIEVSLLSNLAWKKNNPVQMILQSNESEKEAQGTDPSKKIIKTDMILPIELFLDRVLRQCASQLSHLARGLNIPDKIIENAWITLKYILVCESALLQNRHLETMIFCSIYSVCKIDKCDIKFNDILQKFEVLPVSNKNMFHEIAYQVPINDGETKDIIAFYNQVFIKKLRLFFIELPNKSPDTLFQNISNQFLGNSYANSDGYKTVHVKSNDNGKEVTQIKTNKMNKPKTKSLIPEEILQSPLSKLLSSPFMGNAANYNSNAIQ